MFFMTWLLTIFYALQSMGIIKNTLLHWDRIQVFFQTLIVKLVNIQGSFFPPPSLFKGHLVS